MAMMAIIMSMTMIVTKTIITMIMSMMGWILTKMVRAVLLWIVETPSWVFGALTSQSHGLVLKIGKSFCTLHSGTHVYLLSGKLTGNQAFSGLYTLKVDVRIFSAARFKTFLKYSKLEVGLSSFHIWCWLISQKIFLDFHHFVFHLWLVGWLVRLNNQFGVFAKPQFQYFCRRLSHNSIQILINIYTFPNRESSQICLFTFSCGKFFT